MILREQLEPPHICRTGLLCVKNTSAMELHGKHVCQENCWYLKRISSVAKWCMHLPTKIHFMQSTACEGDDNLKLEWLMTDTWALFTGNICINIEDKVWHWAPMGWKCFLFSSRHFNDVFRQTDNNKKMVCVEIFEVVDTARSHRPMQIFIN